MKIKSKILSSMLVFAMLLLFPILVAGCNGSSQKLSLSQGFKFYYVVGESLDLEGGIVKYIDEDGNVQYIDVTNDMVTGFSTVNEGSYKLIITYQNEQLMVTYKVFKLGLTDNAWYKSSTKFNGSYMYVRFDLNNRTMNAVSDINSSAQDVQYIQSVESNGIKLLVDGAEYGSNYSISVYNIKNNTFTLTSTTMHSGNETTFTSTFTLYS